jgi:formamidopyrimidine-DNA glycosylase
VPELPEVETVRRGLERLILGSVVASVEVLTDKSFRGDPAQLAGRAVNRIGRRGKVLIIELDGQLSLVAHLKMTGQMVYRSDESGWGAGHPTGSLIGQLPDASTRVILRFTDGAALFFNDQRKFGWLALMPNDQVAAIPLLAQMGPEPLDGDPWPEFHRRIRRHQRTSIKAALLNQAVVGGIGNIYADEALWAARTHPASLVGDLSDRKLRAILRAAASSIELSLSLGGSTDRNYVDAEGRPGAYLDFAEVFRRDGRPCRRCGQSIVKTRVAGRGTHFCPHCQRLKPASAKS